MDRYTKIEYMCTYCGARTVRVAWTGRPSPGYCSARSNAANGKKWPHRWVVNRRL